MGDRGGFRLVFVEISLGHPIEKYLQNPEPRPYNAGASPGSKVRVKSKIILLKNKYL
jgi:hypothetical protein